MKNRETPCRLSRSHIYRPTGLKIGQNICLDKISDKFEFGSPRGHNEFGLPGVIKLNISQNVLFDKMSEG